MEMMGMIRKFNGEILNSDYDIMIYKTKNSEIYLHWDINGNPIYYVHVHTFTNKEYILVLTNRQKDWLIRMNSIYFWSSPNLSYKELEKKYFTLIDQIYNNDFNKGENYDGSYW